jgi:hypothetical protein
MFVMVVEELWHLMVFSTYTSLILALRRTLLIQMQMIYIVEIIVSTLLKKAALLRLYALPL